MTLLPGTPTIALLLLLVVVPCAAQNLPDPGRRLSPQELRGEPSKPGAQPSGSAESRTAKPPRDAKACERARTSYQALCGAPNSARSRSIECAEAYAIYQRSCFD